jgi:RNA polymerase sigma-70 factor (ECF subfamily)
MTTPSGNDELATLLRSFWTQQGSAEQRRLAQNQLYHRLQSDLDWMAKKVVNHNEELAARAVQEAWLKIFKSAQSYDPAQSSVKTWAKMITARCATDQLRSAYKDNWLVNLNDTESAAPLCELPSPDEQADATALRAVLVRCIAELPDRDGPNFRLAMELCLEEDLSHAQMTEVLAAHAPPGENVNIERVRGWIKRGREKLDACIRGRLNLKRKGGSHE